MNEIHNDPKEYLIFLYESKNYNKVVQESIKYLQQEPNESFYYILLTRSYLHLNQVEQIPKLLEQIQLLTGESLSYLSISTRYYLYLVDNHISKKADQIANLKIGLNFARRFLELFPNEESYSLICIYYLYCTSKYYTHSTNDRLYFKSKLNVTFDLLKTNYPDSISTSRINLLILFFEGRSKEFEKQALLFLQNYPFDEVVLSILVSNKSKKLFRKIKFTKLLINVSKNLDPRLAISFLATLLIPIIIFFIILTITVIIINGLITSLKYKSFFNPLLGALSLIIMTLLLWVQNLNQRINKRNFFINKLEKYFLKMIF